jgi:ADP-ribosylation factor-like protein 5B
MGIALSSLWQRWFGADREYKLTMVGLDNAGKTTLLYRLALGEAVVATPTVGSNVERLVHGGVTLEVWDLGGQQSLRAAWATYYRGSDAVVLVVDSADRARVASVKGELASLLSSADLAGAPLLVFANKQDARGACPAAELSELLGLHAIRGRDWHIQGCVALTGSGLAGGMDWLSQRLRQGKGAAAGAAGAAGAGVGGQGAGAAAAAAAAAVGAAGGGAGGGAVGGAS